MRIPFLELAFAGVEVPLDVETEALMRVGRSGATNAAAPEGVSMTGGAFERCELAKRSLSKDPIG